MSNPFTEQWLADRLARQSKPLRMEIVSVEPKKLKYGNKKTEVDNVVFDSKREAMRYQDLKVMQTAGLISGLTLQPKYPLIVEGEKIGDYIGDFAYVENEKVVVEDVKAPYLRKDKYYRLKKRLMKAIYLIEIRET